MTNNTILIEKIRNENGTLPTGYIERIIALVDADRGQGVINALDTLYTYETATADAWSCIDVTNTIKNYYGVRWMNFKHIVVAAACRQGEVVIVGVRHFDSIMHTQMDAMKGVKWAKAEQGFIDNEGNFLDRREAMALVMESGQPFDAERNGGNIYLFSEGIC